MRANNQNFECVFVRGFSRSGGTMLTTILDSHHDISMSYEIYPNIFEKIGIENIKKGHESLKSNNKLLNTDELKLFNTFFIRSQRGGITKKQYVEILDYLLDKNYGLEKLSYEFTKELAIKKMQMENKKIWGAKSSQSFKGYIKNYSTPFLIGIIRDGRDVCVSQLKNLKRENQSIEKIAQGWVSSTKKIIEMNQNYKNSHIVVYENIVYKPEKEIKILCRKLNLEFDKNMLMHNEQDLTIFKSNHLSMPNLIKPINNDKIGLWKKTLKLDEIKKFNEIAGKYLKKFNYEI